MAEKRQSTTPFEIRASEYAPAPYPTNHQKDLSMTLEKYTHAKAHAHYEQNWKLCSYAICRKIKTCKGGPRGTLRKLKGKTLCATLQPTQKPIDLETIPAFSNSEFIEKENDKTHAESSQNTWLTRL